MQRAKAIWMPGKERPATSQYTPQAPATSQTPVQGAATTKLHHKNADRNTKPSDSRLASQTAEGLDRRFFRSQPRVIGPGSLRRARPRRSVFNLTTLSN